MGTQSAIASSISNPPAPASSSDAAAPVPRSKAKLALAAMVLVALVAGTALALTGRGRESTDDAQVEGRIVNVAPRTGGQVEKVLVKDNERVRAGQVLFELDRRELEARAATARADLASARAQLASARAQLDLTEKTVDANLRQAQGSVTQASAGVSAGTAALRQAEADLEAARARQTLTRLELDRSMKLRSSDTVPQADVDTRRAAHDQASAGLELARARVHSARAQQRSSSGGVEMARGRMVSASAGPEQVAAARAALGMGEARVEQAQAALRLAELNLSYAVVRAPTDGVVSKKTVEPGQNVSPDRPLLALVPGEDVWVVANFKEDQVAQMKPGQKVELKVDTYGRRTFVGHVESLAGASGARFSLLPPDNASGNFTKVVQRIPVLIRFDGTVGVQLRPGMSAYATVVTRS